MNVHTFVDISVLSQFHHICHVYHKTDRRHTHTHTHTHQKIVTLLAEYKQRNINMHIYIYIYISEAVDNSFHVNYYEPDSDVYGTANINPGK